MINNLVQYLTTRVDIYPHIVREEMRELGDENVFLPLFQEGVDVSSLSVFWLFQVEVWGQHLRILEQSSERPCQANAEGWIKDSPSPVIIWLSVNGRSSCLLAEVIFSSYYLGATNKGLWSLFFSVSLLPFSYCLQRYLTNSHVLNNYLPVTNVSGLKKEKKSMFSKDSLAKHFVVQG